MAEVKLTITGEDKSQPVQAGLKATEAAINTVKTAAAALGVSFGLMKLAEWGKESVMLAARYETLGVTMKVIGNNAGYTAEQMEGFQAGLQKTGIAMVESRQNLTMMAQAHIDLAKSAQLARIAQDAAVIGGINSSEAFTRMIYGMQSAQTELLRTIGLNVNFEESYKKLGKQIGKNAADLTELEKAQARTNAVMDKGKDISGAYEAAMGTAGKQVASLKRYFDDLKVKVGETFQGDLTASVGLLTATLKGVSENLETIRTAAGAVIGTGLVVYFARMAEVVTTAVVAENNYQRSVAAGNVVTLGSREASIQKAQASLQAAQAKVVETEATMRATAANIEGLALEQRYWTTIGTTALPLGQRRSEITQQITASTVALTAAEQAQTAAMQANTLAAAGVTAKTAALATAQAEATFASRALAGATAGLNTVMGLLGGPIGLITIGIAAATYAWVKYSEAADVAQAKMEGFIAQRPSSKLALENESLAKMIKAATQTPTQKAEETSSKAQIQMNGLLKEEADLVRRINAAKGETTWYGAKQDTSAMEKRLFYIRRDIEYMPKLIEENKLLAAEMEKINNAKNQGEPPDNKKAQKERLESFKHTAKNILEIEKQNVKDRIDLEKTALDGLKKQYDERVQQLSTFSDAMRTITDSWKTADRAKADASRGFETPEATQRREIAELRAQEEGINASWADPAKKVQDLNNLIGKYREKYKEVKVGTDVIISQQEADRDFAAAEERVREKIEGTAAGMEKKEEAAVSLAQEMINLDTRTNGLNQRITELDRLINALPETKTIDIKLNIQGMDNLPKVAAAMGYQNYGDYYTQGGSTYWSDGTLADSGTSFVGSYASGTNYVPKTGLALVHQGEAIVPAAQNKGGATNVTIAPGAVVIQAVAGADVSALADAAVDALARKLVPKMNKYASWSR